MRETLLIYVGYQFIYAYAVFVKNKFENDFKIASLKDIPDSNDLLDFVEKTYADFLGDSKRMKQINPSGFK